MELLSNGNQLEISILHASSSIPNLPFWISATTRKVSRFGEKLVCFKLIYNSLNFKVEIRRTPDR